MYFDPTWIFETKPPAKDYPNLTGLMDDKPKKPRKQKAYSSMADIFATTDTNSMVHGGKLYNEGGQDYFEPSPKSVQKAGGETQYEAWFRKEFPKIVLMFQQLQQPQEGTFEITPTP